MEIKNIQTFLCVAELKSFTKAAEEMNYAQSTVTTQVQQLERELGFPLFDRIGKHVSLTALGTEFLSHAYKIVSMIDRVSSLNKNLKELRGTLRVGVLESLLLSSVLKVLPEFKKNFPKIDIKLKIGQATELLHQLKENTLDMVYITTDSETDGELNCCYKHAEELVFICSTEHPLAKQKNIPLERLFEEEFIVTEHTGICYTKLQEIAKKSRCVPRDAIEIDSIVAVTHMVKNNMGLGFLPECALKDLLESGKLAKVDARMEKQVYYSKILCHKNRWVSPFMESFIKEISNR